MRNGAWLTNGQRTVIQRHYNHVQSLYPNLNEDFMKRVLFALIASFAVSVPALADQALATAKNCMACHATDKKLVGPAYKEVAEKYKGDKAAVDKLAAKIIKGGAGVWGAVPMPANAQVNDAEAKKLAAWVLSIK